MILIIFILNLLQMKEFNHQVEITRGIMKEECSAVLQDFFRDMRAREQARKDAQNGLTDAE